MGNSTMPKRVARIQRAIEEREDFTGLAGDGEDAVAAWASAHGMNGRALILEWQQAYRLAQAQKTLPRIQGRVSRSAPEKSPAIARDLDHWAGDENDDDGGDDVPALPVSDPDPNEAQPTKSCPSCRGLGTTSDGVRCSRCGGSGRVPATTSMMRTRTKPMTTKTKTERPAVMPAGETDVMTHFDQLRSVLSETHSTIPSLLAGAMTLRRQLGLAEAEGKDAGALRESLAATEGGRESAARKRGACLDALLELEPQLQGLRAGVERDRQAYAVAAVAAFRLEYDAVSQIQVLWRKAEDLGKALRITVPAPVPARIQVSVVDGSPQLMALRSNGGAAPVVDEEALTLGAQLDRLDAALSLIGAIKQSRELDQRDHRLGLLRGTAGGHAGGAFRVIQEFVNSIDALPFRAGDLVDDSLIGGAMLRRLQTGKRYLQPLNLESAAA
jgi:hypothetical protein